MSGRKLLFVILILFTVVPVMAQNPDDLSLDDFEQKLKRTSNLNGGMRQDIFTIRRDKLDSLLVEDPTNLVLIDQSIGLNIANYRFKDAWLDYQRLDSLTLGEPHLFFYKASLLEYFGAIDSAQVMFQKHLDHLEEVLKESDDESVKADQLLAIWYTHMYMGEEEKAREIIDQLYNDYQEWVSVGIGNDYFMNRFSQEVLIYN